MELLEGQCRQTLFNVQSLAVTGSYGLDAQDAKFYRRFVGAISIATGSATFRYRMGASSGNFLVSSTMPVNSGVVAIVDVLNLGRYADFGFSAINSQPNVAAFLLGDSQR